MSPAERVAWTAGITVVVSWLLTAGLVRFCRQRGWIVPPTPDRWHEKPTATYGGVAVFAAATCGVAIFVVPYLATVWRPDIVGLLVGGMTIFAVGLRDDIKRLNPLVKMVGQMVAITPFLAGMGLFRMSEMFMLGIPLIFVWMLGMTNAFNLIDNMDGLCPGTAVIVGVFVTLRCLRIEDMPTAETGLVVLCSCVGFLYFNFRLNRRAAIFLGDCGSMFIGYMLAGLSTTAFWGFIRLEPALIVVPALFMAVPIFDTILVIVRRRREGRAVSQGGRDHTSHRLVYAGLTDKQAVLLLLGVSVMSGMVGSALEELRTLSVSLGVTTALALLLYLSGTYLSRFKSEATASSEEPGARSQDALLAADPHLSSDRHV